MKKYTFCCTHWHSTVTSITEEVLSFSLVNHCPQHINFVDRVQVVEVNTCEQGVETEKKRVISKFHYQHHASDLTGKPNPKSCKKSYNVDLRGYQLKKYRIHTGYTSYTEAR